MSANWKAASLQRFLPLGTKNVEEDFSDVRDVTSREAENEIALLHVCTVSGCGYDTGVHSAQVRSTKA